MNHQHSRGEYLFFAVYALLILFWIGFAVYGASAARPATWRGLEIDDRSVADRRCSQYVEADYDAYRNIYDRLKRSKIEAAGGNVDGYTLAAYTTPDQLDLDHRVARLEAHVSGLCGRSLAQRKAFSQDPANLVLSHWYVNRHVKRAYDAGGWTPPKNKCAFAAAVVRTKTKFRLTVDRAEVRALDKILKKCD